ncbi:MAG: ligase [Alicyclobacillaceae bacterium]|nr:ligase [Alicyclobacillaceae bacterium]
MAEQVPLRAGDVVECTWLEDGDDSQRNVDLDVQLGADVGAGRRPPTVRLWRAAPGLGIGVSRRDVATDAACAAAQRLRQHGVDVVVRQTGGTAVPQGEGVFHVSWLLPRPAGGATTDQYYHLLCDPLVSWLRSFHVEATTGPLPGSYCDGRYNVLAGGRKLAGTAQAWKGGLAGLPSSRPGFVLAHACVTVMADHELAAVWINRFYEWAGQPWRVTAETGVNLADLVPAAFAGQGAAAATERAVRSFAGHLGEWLSRRGVRWRTTPM